VLTLPLHLIFVITPPRVDAPTVWELFAVDTFDAVVTPLEPNLFGNLKLSTFYTYA